MVELKNKAFNRWKDWILVFVSKLNYRLSFNLLRPTCLFIIIQINVSTSRALEYSLF